MNRGTSPVATLQAAISDYIDWHSLRGSSARHRTDIERMLQAFAAVAGPERLIDEVTREDCSRFLRRYQERCCKPSTLKAYHRVLDAFFTWLLQEEQLSISPMKRVPKPKLLQEQIKPLTQEELIRLLAQPDTSTFVGLRDTAFIGLLSDTGLRLSEANSIHLADVDTRQRSISVMGKGGKARVVFYGESVALMLRSYLKRRRDPQSDDLLFVNQYGEQMLRFCMSERIREYGAAAGIKGKRVSPHTLRHTFSVSWLMGGGDTLSLQRLLGHSSPEMTTRYVNFANTDLAELHQTNSPLDRLKASGASPQGAGRKTKKRLR